MANNETNEKNVAISRTGLVLVVAVICVCLVIFQLRGCHNSGQTGNTYKQKIDSLQTEIRKYEEQKVRLDQKADSLHKQLIVYQKEIAYFQAKTTELKTHRSSAQYVVRALPDSSLIRTFAEELAKFSQRRDLQ